MNTDLGLITAVFLDNDSHFIFLQDLRPQGNSSAKSLSSSSQSCRWKINRWFFCINEWLRRTSFLQKTVLVVLIISPFMILFLCSHSAGSQWKSILGVDVWGQQGVQSIWRSHKSSWGPEGTLESRMQHNLPSIHNLPLGIFGPTQYYSSIVESRNFKVDYPLGELPAVA